MTRWTYYNNLIAAIMKLEGKTFKEAAMHLPGISSDSVGCKYDNFLWVESGGTKGLRGVSKDAVKAWNAVKQARAEGRDPRTLLH
jgi:hypothetical protein